MPSRRSGDTRRLGLPNLGVLGQEPHGLGREHDLERVRLGGGREDVVRGLRVGEREPVRRERRRIEPPLLDQLAAAAAVVVVSTRPVVIVMSRIHSVSRWSVAEWPCTPTFATRPPGRTIAGAELERLGHADRLDGDVDAEPFRQLHDARDRDPRCRC